MKAKKRKKKPVMHDIGVVMSAIPFIDESTELEDLRERERELVVQLRSNMAHHEELVARLAETRDELRRKPVMTDQSMPIGRWIIVIGKLAKKYGQDAVMRLEGALEIDHA